MNLTDAAQTGFDLGGVSPYCRTSHFDRAYRIGLICRENGMARPVEVRTSKGHSYHVRLPHTNLKANFAENETDPSWL